MCHHINMAHSVSETSNQMQGDECALCRIEVLVGILEELTEKYSKKLQEALAPPQKPHP